MICSIVARMCRTRLRVLSLAVALLTAPLGCFSSSAGNRFDPNKVSTIQRHVTTRAQIEAMFGTPTSVALMGDGRRSMLYTHVDTETQVKGTTFIPVVGAFAGGATGKQRIQTLQVILGKDNVVDDYEFNNSTQDIDTNTGLSGAHTTITQSPTTQPAGR